MISTVRQGPRGNFWRSPRGCLARKVYDRFRPRHETRSRGVPWDGEQRDLLVDGRRTPLCTDSSRHSQQPTSRSPPVQRRRSYWLGPRLRITNTLDVDSYQTVERWSDFSRREWRKLLQPVTQRSKSCYPRAFLGPRSGIKIRKSRVGVTGFEPADTYVQNVGRIRPLINK